MVHTIFVRRVERLPDLRTRDLALMESTKKPFSAAVESVRVDFAIVPDV